MKKRISWILMVLMILMGSWSAVWAEEVPFAEEDMLETSSDFAEIEQLKDEIQKEAQGAEIDYSKALKVYVDTDIIALQTSDTEAILQELGRANYVWVIPTCKDGVYGMITLGRGLPLSEDAKEVLTLAEQEEVRQNEGKWMVTKAAEGTVKAYFDTIMEKPDVLAGCSRVVLVGSQPGMHNPMALGMTDSNAAVWISLGYQYAVLDDIPAAQSMEEGVYDFTTVADAAQGYVVNTDESGGAGTAVKEEQGKSTVVTCIAILVVVGILAATGIGFYRKRSNG